MDRDSVNLTPDQLGARIREARVAAGLTQDEAVEALAEHGVPLTKAGLSKYERGGSMPKPTVLLALARALGVDSAFFLEDRTAKVKWLAFRKATALSAKSQDRIKAACEALACVFVELQSSLEPSRKFSELVRTPVRSFDDAERAAETLREHWKLGESPIDSVASAIEDNGGLVVEIDGEGDLFDGLSGWVNDRIPVIAISASLSDDRRRFSLSHELGHLVMELDSVDESAEEKLAHRFAAAFLVPASTARRELGERRRHLDLRELAVLKEKHGLSMQAWIYRAADLGIIEHAHLRTLFAEMTRLGWRRVEPVDFVGQERATRLRQLTVRAYAEGVLSATQAERIIPGVTSDRVSPVPPATTCDARALLRMSREDRDRVMERAAALVEDDYKDGGALRGFDANSEGDLSDDDD